MMSSSGRSGVMPLILATSALLSLASLASGDTEIDGNWYGNAVQAVRYTNVGTGGTYNAVVDMAPDGVCSTQPKAFSGPLSPLNEEVSLHFRGPIVIKQIAVYMPTGAGQAKRDLFNVSNHLHKKAHARSGSHHKREMISAEINGQMVSWENDYYAAVSAGPSATPEHVMVTATIDGIVQSWTNNYFGPSSSTAPVATPEPASSVPSIDSAPSAPTSSASPLGIPVQQEGSPHIGHADAVAGQTSDFPTSPNSAPGAYERIAYYDSASQATDNLVFLGNMGGQGSGVFDYNYGASLSYIDCNAKKGASSPQVLANTLIPSNSEVIVMLNNSCSDGGCGYSRPGSVAYHGFDGADKIFLLEFGMPNDGSDGFNANMPAIWMLNALIPRTVQYGKPDCSCWSTGCGEFDIAESLNDGSDYLKSTLHTNTPGGDKNYFNRPVSGTMKLAVVFSSADSTLQVQVLDNDFDFGNDLSTDDIQHVCSSNSPDAISYFQIT